MKYETLMKLRMLSLVGLLLFAVGQSLEWPLAVLLGIPLWVYLMPASSYGFAYLIVMIFKNSWMMLRSRKERVPGLVKGLASESNTSPPKHMKILPSFKFNAAVKDDTLYVTEGLKPWLWTTMGIGVIAHEMAHKSRNHSLKLLVAFLLSGLLILGILEFLADSRWPITVCVILTVVTTVIPSVFRFQEYEADRQAANVLGAETMIRTLKVIGDWSSRDEDSETHPSITKRIGRLARHTTVS